ncbi:H/ACA ribonucleoprotein complex subunit 1 [Hypsizygus marmoreus]|uniref:H/ACA ribonucleoprotein complex subunit n=1 Tax=Hypsizygus marmoreus TaxID=39966 RepID=A0A369JMC7_HYPMA|nr:H/ACA ribonucleoprotein complex subunit 1 [Hypsizygus marmoreus]
MNRGGSRGFSRGGGGGRGGGRGGFQQRDMGPPDQVLEMGSFVHAVEDEMLCSSLILDKVPYFNAPIYLQNKSVIGRVDEILGPINEVYFSVKMGEGMIASSFKKGDKVFIGGDKLLPIERFLPKPKVAGGVTSKRLINGVVAEEHQAAEEGAVEHQVAEDFHEEELVAELEEEAGEGMETGEDLETGDVGHREAVLVRVAAGVVVAAAVVVGEVGGAAAAAIEDRSYSIYYFFNIMGYRKYKMEYKVRDQCR